MTFEQKMASLNRGGGTRREGKFDVYREKILQAVFAN